MHKSLGNGEGDTRLNISIVLAAVHGLSGLFRAVSAVPGPFPTLSPSLIGSSPPPWTLSNIKKDVELSPDR